MPRAAVSLTNFTAGEFSPKLNGRTEIEAYHRGAATIQNFLITNYGSAFKRPGTKYVAEVKDSSKTTRLISFVFSDDQTYVIEMGHLYMRFYKDSGQLQADDPSDWVTGTTYAIGEFVVSSTITYICRKAHTSGTFATDLAAGKWLAQEIYEIITVFEEDELFDVQFAQTGDLVYFAHPDHKPQQLSRTGDLSWAIADFENARGPFKDTNTTAVTLTPSADTGNDITITASAATFTADHVGSLWRIKDGVVKIDTFTSTTSVKGDVQAEPDGTDGALGTGPGATTDWAEGSWSEDAGWPRAVAFFEQRTYWSGTLEEPTRIWGSVIGEFTNYDEGTSDDDDAVTYVPAMAQNPTLWLIGSRRLFVGNKGGLYSLSSGSESTTLTPSNAAFKEESGYGANKIQPVKIGSFTYYIQDNTTRVREISYSFEIDSYRAADMTLLSEHILGDGAVDIAYQQSNDDRIWIVRKDGQLVSITRQIDQNVISPGRNIIGGSFGSGDAVVESVVSIPEGTEGQVWLIVKRTINGETKRYIEYITAEDYGDDQEDAFFVDCGLTYDGVSATTITGLDHLEGETVTILADGGTHPTKVVTNGSITLDRAASVVHVGFGYTGILKTLKIEAGAATGTAQNKYKKVYDVGVRLYESLGGIIDSISVDISGGTETTVSSQEIYYRDPSMPMDSPPPLFTGDKILAFGAGMNKLGIIQIRHEAPLPIHVLAMYPRLVTYD